MSRDLLDEVMQSLLGSVGHEAETIDRIREIVGEKPQGRRIVQIQSDADGMVALCDDGTLWGKAGDWTRILPDIPQDAPAESPDPIAELEAMGGLLFIDAENFRPVWFCRDEMEVIADEGDNASVSDLRAAAARLLARVRGESNA